MIDNSTIKILKEYYDNWDNIVEYSYINSDRMHYNFNLVIQVNDKYYQTVFPDYMDEDPALFENLNWVEVTPTTVEIIKYIPVTN